MNAFLIGNSMRNFMFSFFVSNSRNENALKFNISCSIRSRWCETTNLCNKKYCHWPGYVHGSQNVVRNKLNKLTSLKGEISMACVVAIYYGPYNTT